jgi:hypothetical protein
VDRFSKLKKLVLFTGLSSKAIVAIIEHSNLDEFRFLPACAFSPSDMVSLANTGYEVLNILLYI